MTCQLTFSTSAHSRDSLRSFNMTYKMKELTAFYGYYSPEEKIRSHKRPGDSCVSIINLLARLFLHSTQLLILRSRRLIVFTGKFHRFYALFRPKWKSLNEREMPTEEFHLKRNQEKIISFNIALLSHC